jgi:hypothetical protein
MSPRRSPKKRAVACGSIRAGKPSANGKSGDE